MLGVIRDPGRTAGVGNPEITDLERRVADLVRYGEVTAVDYSSPPKVRVGIGDPADEDGYIETGWLPMAGGRAQGDREWHPLEVGERVIVLSEGGELQCGVVIPHGFFNADTPANGDKAGLWRKTFSDGAVIEYDRDAHAMTLGATGAGSLTLRAGGCEIVMSGGVITLKGSRIVTDGETVLNNGTRPVAYQGAKDTAGEPLVDGASGVLV